MAPPTTFVELGRRLRARTHDSASGGGGSGSHARIQQQGRDDDSDDEMVDGSPGGADASDNALDGDAPDGAVAAHLSAATGTADFFSLVSELPSELCIKCGGGCGQHVTALRRIGEAHHRFCIGLAEDAQVDEESWRCSGALTARSASGDDDAHLLLCDCGKAFHTYCLRPPLKTVPSGEWRCPSCVSVTRALPHLAPRARWVEAQLSLLRAMLRTAREAGLLRRVLQ